MSSTSYRPGIVLGRYPQKKSVDSGWLTKRLTSIAARIKACVFKYRYQPAYIIKQVNRFELNFKTLSEPELTEAIEKLRTQLIRRGLTDPLIVESFALIREVAGRTLGKRHFNSQVFGGWIMINGMLAQMATGEGKTLTTTLPACTAALAGIPVHIITANDYLAQRDAENLEPLYSRLGLTTGAIFETMTAEKRHNVYQRDIVHICNKQIAFDYLRDRIAMNDNIGNLRLQFQQIQAEQYNHSPLLLRGLCFAIIDEADSVLIDEAGTPLIISKSIDDPDDQHAYVGALFIASSLQTPRDFSIQSDRHEITLTPEGSLRIGERTKTLPKAWQSKTRREALIKLALTAEHLYRRDHDYLVRDNKIQIIDQQTGRVMADRSWEEGLHQMVEAKEGCIITSRRETLARITYQRFFSRYLRLAGTSGTLTEITAELQEVYKLPIITVPTHKPSQRILLPDRLYTSSVHKWQAFLSSVTTTHHTKRPILIGTCSVAESEEVSKLLSQQGIEHRVLNARQDQQEAEIVAQAGQMGAVTVATNMAGRGTDIELGEGVSALGGLHVIATMHNQERRIDRQLYGRAARQGDPGSSEAFLSLEDELIIRTYPQSVIKLLTRLAGKQALISGKLADMIILLPQKLKEREHRKNRRLLMLQDKQYVKLLAFSGKFE